MIRDSNQCCACHRKAKQVHHLNYLEDTLRGVDIDALVAICGRCHKAIEIGPNGGKRQLVFANEVLWSLCQSNNRSTEAIEKVINTSHEIGKVLSALPRMSSPRKERKRSKTLSGKMRDYWCPLCEIEFTTMVLAGGARCSRCGHSGRRCRASGSHKRKAIKGTEPIEQGVSDFVFPRGKHKGKRPSDLDWPSLCSMHGAYKHIDQTVVDQCMHEMMRRKT